MSKWLPLAAALIGLAAWVDQYAGATPRGRCVESTRLRATAEAVELFRLAEGRLPDSLEELCVGEPPVLIEVPEDCSGHVVQYAQDGEHYTLWSVAPDDPSPVEPSDAVFW